MAHENQRVRTWEGSSREILGDEEGRQYVVEGGRGYVFTVTGAAAISLKTTMNGVFPNRPWRLKHISVNFDSAPTTSENITLTQNPGSLFADRPSTVLFSNDPAATSATDVVNIWEAGGLKMQPGDEVTLAYTNTDTKTVKAEIVVEIL